MPDTPTHTALRFCPFCGRETFAQATPKRLDCSSCGGVLYINSAAAAGGLVTDDAGRLLVIERNRPPAEGTWDLPGGFVDPGETAEDTVRREAREETGLDVAVTGFFGTEPNVYPFKGVEYPVLDLIYRCRPVGDPSAARPVDTAEIRQVLWVPREDLVPERFGLASTRRIIERWLRR